MRLSDKFPVPRDAALLYDFVNSLDLRRYVEGGVAHAPADELATAAQMEDWLRARGLLASGGVRLDPPGHLEGLALREALRGFLQLSPSERAADAATARQLDAASRPFPLALQAAGGGLVLRPAGHEPHSGLGAVLAELYRLSETGRMDRLKICASDECHWMFYDRSKPGNRRWCSSAICGNRQKTRSYRERRRGGGDA